MTRALSVIPATVTVGAVLLLGWGCATAPPSRSPEDPFAPAPNGPPMQQNFRPQYYPPPTQRYYRLPEPAPYRPFSPPTRSMPPAPQGASPTPLPKTFAEPTPNSSVPNPTRPNPAQPYRPNPARPYRTDRPPNLGVPQQQIPSRPIPKKEPAPVTPTTPDGPLLIPPEDLHSTAKHTQSGALGEPVELTIDVPDRRPIGSGAPFRLTLRNASGQMMRNLSILCEFDDPLTFPGSDRKSVTHKIPKIEPGDARESLLTLISDRPGRYACRFTVSVGSRPVAQKSVSVEFVSRQLDWQIHGPTERTVDSRAEYNIPLINVTDRDLENLTVQVDLDAALTLREMTQGGQLTDRGVTWTIDRLKANEGLLLQLEVECREPTTQACLSARVHGDGVPEDDAMACLTVRPISGLLDVRVQDVSDPVAVGEEAELVITIINQGLQTAKNVVVTCRWPIGFEFLAATFVRGDKSVAVQADVQGQSATLPPIPRLGPDQRLEFRLKLKADQAGSHQFTVTVSDAANSTPVEVMEPIMVHR